MKNIKFSFTLFLGVLILLFTTFSTINAVEKDPVFLKSGVELKEDIIVNGQILKVPAPYFYRGDEGIVMVPLRAIAQELGLNVAWNGNDKSVTIGYEIRVFIDQNYYMWCETYQIEFGPSPELTQNYTYVPLPFFKYAIKGCEITVSEDGSVIIDKDPSTVIWFEPNNSSYATYSDDFPENYSGLSIDNNQIHVGKTQGGGDVFSFLHLPLGGDFLADEVVYAKLYLKTAEGIFPDSILIGAINQNWSSISMDCNQAKAVVDKDNLILLAVSDEGDGWVSIYVTDIVKSWLSGNLANFGFTFWSLNDEEKGVFIAGNDSGYLDTPYLEVRGKVGERSQKYGKFNFSMQPEEGLSLSSGGNCLAYALRDKDPILFDDLVAFGADANQLNDLLGELGVDELVERFAGFIEEYVQANKEGLKISEFRRLDSYDAPIDSDLEYRIALRVGGQAVPTLVLNRLSFDFHLWAQVEDGRWAQKYPRDYSEIIPGTGPEISPEKYKWNSAKMWIEKYKDYYDSKVIYFAVTKDTDEFTSHKHSF